VNYTPKNQVLSGKGSDNININNLGSEVELDCKSWRFKVKKLVCGSACQSYLFSANLK
jgi:hypothetical protein